MGLLISNQTFSQGLDQTGGTAAPKNSLLPHSPEAESLGKFGDIPVGLYTGVPNVSIPIYQMKLKNVTVPISLDYHASGVKVDELASNAGLDWALNAGGVINNIQYGLSDFGGWLNPATGFSTPQTAYPQESWYNTQGFATNNDYLFLKYSADGTLDTQPDVFAFSFLGRSGKFFFDQSGVPRLMPHQNIKIDYTKNNSNVIISYTLTDEHGTKFYFSSVESTSTTSSSCDGSGSTSNFSWSFYLTKIMTTNGEELDFNYQTIGYNINDPDSEVRYQRTDVGAPGYSACPDIPNCVTANGSTVGALRLVNITNPNTGDNVVFTYTNNRTDIPGTQSLDQIEVFNGAHTSIKRVNLGHSYFYSAATNSTNVNDFRLKLTSVQEVGKAPYLFDYNATTLPSRLSHDQDHWGYYNGPLGNPTLLPKDTLNGFLSGADRTPDINYMNAGVLSKITYPTGGSTVFNYEGNDTYMDYNKTTINNDGAGGGASPNQTVTQNFTIPVGAGNFKASWTTNNSDSGNGGLDPDGNNTQIILTGSNGFFQNFIGNSNGTIDYNYNNSITFVPGNYTLSISNTTSAAQAIGAFNLYWQTSTSTHIQRNELAGGLRIKSLTDNPVTGSSKTKYFEYTDVNDPTKSSGVSMYQPKYTFDYHKYNVQQGTNYVTQCTYNAQQASSVAPLGSIQGGNVIYSNVIVYDDAKTNGYTANEFVTNGNSYGYSFTPTFPFPPLTNFEWLNGLPVKTTQYKYNTTNGSYFPLTINQKNYKMAPSVGPNEVLVRGMKVGYVYPEFAGTIANTPVNFAQNVPAEFKIGYYYLYSSWFHLDQETNIEYDMNGGNPKTTTVNYYYDNPTHIQLTRTVTTQSNGKPITAATTYPDDYAVGTTFLDDMKTNHQVAYPIEQVSYQTDGSNVTILGGQLSNYLPGGKGLIDNVAKLKAVNAFPLSSFKFSNSATGQLPFAATGGAYSVDSHYLKQLTYNLYDNTGNPLVMTPNYSVPISYQWGYSKQYPIAECRNALNTEFYYEGFEENTAANVQTSASGGHTGNKYINGTYTVSWALPNARGYYLTYWYKTGGVWKYADEQNFTGSLTLPAADGYDDIRIYPKDAQITTYTYNPLTGMTSATDTKGITTYYYYDSNNRLTDIKDQYGRILKHTDYHYQNY